MMNNHTTPNPKKHSGFVSLISVLILLSIVAYVLTNTMFSGRTTAMTSSANADSIRALFVAETGLQRAATVLKSTGKSTADCAAYQNSQTDTTSEGGKITYPPPEGVTTASQCYIRVLGQFGKASRILEGRFTLQQDTDSATYLHYGVDLFKNLNIALSNLTATNEAFVLTGVWLNKTGSDFGTPSTPTHLEHTWVDTTNNGSKAIGFAGGYKLLTASTVALTTSSVLSPKNSNGDAKTNIIARAVSIPTTSNPTLTFHPDNNDSIVAKSGGSISYPGFATGTVAACQNANMMIMSLASGSEVAKNGFTKSVSLNGHPMTQFGSRYPAVFDASKHIKTPNDTNPNEIYIEYFYVTYESGTGFGAGSNLRFNDYLTDSTLKPVVINNDNSTDWSAKFICVDDIDLTAFNAKRASFNLDNWREIIFQSN